VRERDRRTIIVAWAAVTAVLALILVVAGQLPWAVLLGLIGLGGLVAFLRVTHPQGHDRPRIGIFFDEQDGPPPPAPPRPGAAGAAESVTPVRPPADPVPDAAEDAARFAPEVPAGPGDTPEEAAPAEGTVIDLRDHVAAAGAADDSGGALSSAEADIVAEIEALTEIDQAAGGSAEALAMRKLAVVEEERTADDGSHTHVRLLKKVQDKLQEYE
jgi:hypothetical protein